MNSATVPKNAGLYKKNPVLCEKRVAVSVYPRYSNPTEAITRKATKGKNMNALEVKKVGRSFCVVVGVSVLGKFRTEAAASASLASDWDMYSYWAGSCSVSVENTPAVVVKI